MTELIVKGEGDESAENSGCRLDKFLISRYPLLNRGELHKLMRKGHIRVNSVKVKASTRVFDGNTIKVPPFFDEKKIDASYKTEDEASRILIDKSASEALMFFADNYLYSNNKLLAINKPAGIAVQGGTGLRYSIDSLAAALWKKYKSASSLYDKKSTQGINLLQGIDNEVASKVINSSCLHLVHRLDKPTSGVLILAKGREYARIISELFAGRRIKKQYWAITNGYLPATTGEINIPLPLHNSSDHAGAEEAVTGYKVLGQNNDYSLVELYPLTGRKHQLRQHLSAIGNAIVGDKQYNSNEPTAPFLMLHAKKIKFLADDISAPLEAPLPKYFSDFIKKHKLANCHAFHSKI